MCFLYIYMLLLLELNECVPAPCLNGGTCVDGVRDYTCNCDSFTEDGVLIYYTGRNCGTGEEENFHLSHTVPFYNT